MEATLDVTDASERRTAHPDRLAASNHLQHIRIKRSSGYAALNLRELWEFRDLLWMLAARDVKLRYKQTALGVVWVVLQPLLPALIFAVIFGRVANLPSDGVPYVLFAYVGLLPWNLFAGSLTRGGNSLVAEARLITKVYFPRVILPLASCVAVVVDFLVGLAFAVIFMAAYQVAPSFRILALPALALLALVIAVGIALWLSALNVRYRDFAYVVPFFVQVWMYATPIVYSSTMIPARWRLVYSLNPMAGVIDGFRWAILGTGSFPGAALGLSALAGIVLLVVGAFVFRRVERSFADVI